MNIDPDVFLAFDSAIKGANNDGIFFDILVEDTEAGHWRNFLSFIKSSCTYSFLYDGVTRDLPDDNNYTFPDEFGFLTINYLQLTIKCYMLEQKMIDMFIDPKQLVNEYQIINFMHFLFDVAKATTHNVEVSIEGAGLPFIIVSNSGSIYADTRSDT